MIKNKRKQPRKNKSFLVMLLFFTIICTLQMLMVSAIEWDNIKNFEETQNSYGKITIRNSVLGIPFLQLDKVIELELKENSDICEGFDCYAEKEVTIYEKGILIEDIRFLYVKENYYDNLNYKLLIKKGKEFVPYQLGEVVEAGTYEVRLEGLLPDIFTTIDWQIKSNNLWINEWAIWTSNLNQNLLSYWNMTNTTNTFIPDLATSLSNITIHRNGEDYPNLIVGALGYGQRGWESNQSILNVTTNPTRLGSLNRSFSLSFWINNTKNCPTAVYFLTNENMGIGFQKGASIGCQLILSGTELGGVVNAKTAGILGNDSKWHHYGIVVNATNGIDLYYDGVLNMTNHSLGTTNLNGSMFRTGAAPFSSANVVWTEMSFDEMGVWNRELTGTEMSQLYNSGAALTYIGIDSEAELNTPKDNNITLANDIMFSANLTSTAGNLDNATLYLWHSNGSEITNFTDSPTGTGIYVVNQSLSDLGIDNSIKWNFQVCSSGLDGDCNFALNNFTLTTTNFIENSQTFNSMTAEGNNENFNLNITVLPTNLITSATFLYNDTEYSPTINLIGTDNYNLSQTITIPSVTTDTSTNFSWGLTFASGFVQNTTNITQNITNLNIDNCTSYGDMIFNFTVKDEDTQDTLNGVSDGVNIKAELELYKAGSTEILINFSKEHNQSNTMAICLKQLNSTVYQVNAIIEYSSSGRYLEFYNIQNFTLTNSTWYNNISLYNLNSSTGQEFKITYKDDNFNTVPGAILQIQRKYIDEGLFKTIEIPKFSSAGYTIGHLIRSDIVYNLIVIRNGTVLDSFNNIVANCQTPSLSECEININSLGSSVSAGDFDSVGDFSSTLSFDEDTRTVTSTFVVTNGVSQDTSLNVTLFDAFGNTSVCNDNLFASGGTLSCTIPNSFGNTTTYIKVYSGGEVKKEAILKIASDPPDIYGASLVFVGLILMLLVIGMGISENPLALGVMLIMGIVLLIGANIVASTSWVGAGATILWLIIAIVIVLIKGSNRQ